MENGECWISLLEAELEAWEMDKAWGEEPPCTTCLGRLQLGQPYLIDFIQPEVNDNAPG